MIQNFGLGQSAAHKDTKLTKELGHKDISDSDHFLIWDCLHLGLFTKIVHCNEDLLITFIGFQNINHNMLHGLPNTVKLQ